MNAVPLCVDLAYRVGSRVYLGAGGSEPLFIVGIGVEKDKKFLANYSLHDQAWKRVLVIATDKENFWTCGNFEFLMSGRFNSEFIIHGKLKSPRLKKAAIIGINRWITENSWK